MGSDGRGRRRDEAARELELHVQPVLLGRGRRLFDHLHPEPLELARTRVLEGEGGVMHMHYRVER